MSSSWDNELFMKPREPTPQERLESLKGFYAKKPLITVLLEALGAYPSHIPDTPIEGAPLVEHMLIVCIDTESDTSNTDCLTEVGMNTFSRRDGRAVASNPGPYGVRIMEQVRFLHFRIVEHAHLATNRVDALGALGNRFGHSRFASFKEMRTVMRSLFNQPVKSNDPALKGCMRPVVLVGHALRHDIENRVKKGLEYDFAANSTIVARVDTQSLARDLKIWVPPANMRTNEIGLRALIQDKAGFLHLDDHTASNDAARTMLCAIWMAVPRVLKDGQAKTMQQVANRIEMLSQRDEARSPNPFGTVFCCIKCGSRDHPASTCSVAVQCAACNRFDTSPSRDDNVASHIETYCPHVAQFKAWARRFRDAWIKHRSTGRALKAEVLVGPGSEAHPWSTWTKPGPRDWPLDHLDEVLQGMAMSREPDLFVYNLQSALGGIPVPSGGDWIMDAAKGSATSSPASNDLSMTALRSALPVVGGRPLSSGSFPALPTSSVTPSPSSAPPVWAPNRGASAGPTTVPATAAALGSPTRVANTEVTQSTSRARGGNRGRLGRGGGRAGGRAVGGNSSGSTWDAWND